MADLPQSDWALLKPRITAVIDGVEIDGCQELACAYEVNTIAQASLTIAPGRDLTTDLPSSAAQLLRAGAQAPRIQIYLQAERAEASSAAAYNKWGRLLRERVLVFDGEVMAVYPNLTTRAAGLTVLAKHWLSILDESSTISASSHPGNPAAFTADSVFLANSFGNAGGLDPTSLPMCAIQQAGVTRALLEAGLWESVLQPWMKSVASTDRIDPRLAGGGDQAAVLAALDRMLPDNRPSTAMDFGDSDGNAIASAIAENLGQETFGQWATQTLWGKLIHYWCPAFLLRVSPRPGDAIIAPALGAFSGQPLVALGPADGFAQQPQMTTPRRLRAIAIAHPVASRTGGSFAAQPDITQPYMQGIAGLYPLEPAGKGLVLVRPPPDWLQNDVSATVLQSAASALVPSSVDTAVAPAGAAVNSAVAQKSFLQRYAQHLYSIESLRDRVGELRGPLRLDIAPGSTISIAGDARTDESLLQFMYALVTRVTLRISAMAQQGCSTTLSLSHIRTAAENAEAQIATDKPALYTEAWAGAPLVDNLEG